MTEQEWLASDDPRVMLAHLGFLLIYPSQGRKISDGQLRSWVEACRAQCGGGDRPLGRYDLTTSHGLSAAAVAWCEHEQSVMPDPLPLRAEILRDIVGNPFAPIRVSQGGRTARQVKAEQASVRGCCNRHADNQACDCLKLAGDVLPVWLTPTVCAIVRDCHERNDFTELPVAADALEDAGCDCAVLLQHLRGFDPCPRTQTVKTDSHCPSCRGSGYWRRGVGFDHEKRCSNCDIVWEPGEPAAIPCRRCDGSGQKKIPRHYRGCWACELITEG